MVTDQKDNLDVTMDGLSVAVAEACATMERLTIQRDRLIVLVSSGLELFDGDDADTTNGIRARVWADHARKVLAALDLPVVSDEVTV